MNQTENPSEDSNVKKKGNNDVEIEKFLSRYSFKNRFNALEDKSDVVYYGSIKVYETLAMSKRIRIHSDYLLEKGYTHIIIHQRCSET